MNKDQQQSNMNVLLEARNMRNSSTTSLLSSHKVPQVKKARSKDQLQVEPPKHAKRVTFSRQRRLEQPQQTTVKESDTQTGLTSCLITNPTWDPRVAGGANNPAERRVGWLARTDSECQIKAPGIDFLTERDTNVITFEVKMRDSLQSVKDYTTKCDYFPKYVDGRPYKDQATQTLYRESSAQTVAYLPDIMDKEQDENLELFNLATALPGDKPPGLYEVEILERTRKRWAFNNALKTSFKQQLHEAREEAMKSKYRPILEAFEWEHWIEREEYIQECQMMRLEIVIRMFDKREKAMHTASKTRIETACETIEKRRQHGLSKNEVQYQRAIRRLQIQHTGISRRWKKQSPMYALGSPCSEFYGPLIRHGVDPARRSFVGDGRKAFDMRIDDLEKRVNMDQLQCPFTKLKEWSKPKEYVKEYEQNFCSDKHLQKLYESLKSLRSQATKQKTTPKCLKRRPKPDSERDNRVSYNYEYMDVSNYFKDRARRTEESKVIEVLSHEQQMAIQQHMANEDLRERMPNVAEDQLRESRHEDLEQLLHMYEGSTIGWIMQFLTEEMERLQEQRKLHFFTILAQKERWRREAAEAGLRQKENEMRLLYEEMFQQSNVVHNEITDDYINTILTTDMTHIAECDATDTVVALAKQIDADIQRWLDSFKGVQTAMTYEPLRHMLREMIFPDLNKLLLKYEKQLIVKYIIDDVIFAGMWDALESYDISSTLASDLIDRLIDNDLYLFSTDSESDTPHRSSWYEIHAILRKLIRQAVLGRRWKTENERIVDENCKSLFDDIFDQIVDKVNMGPEPIEPVLLRHVMSTRTIKDTDNIRLMEEILKLDSIKQSKLDDPEDGATHLRTQMLSLLKKLKTDKITRALVTDELYPVSDDTFKDKEVVDKLIKTDTYNKAVKEDIVQQDVFGIISTLDFGKEEDFTVLRKSTTAEQQKLLKDILSSPVTEIGVEFDNLATQTNQEDVLIGMLNEIVSTEGEELFVEEEYEADDERSWWNPTSEEEEHYKTEMEEHHKEQVEEEEEEEEQIPVPISSKIELLETVNGEEDPRLKSKLTSNSFFAAKLGSKLASGNISNYDLSTADTPMPAAQKEESKKSLVRPSNSIRD